MTYDIFWYGTILLHNGHVTLINCSHVFSMQRNAQFKQNLCPQSPAPSCSTNRISLHIGHCKDSLSFNFICLSLHFVRVQTLFLNSPHILELCKVRPISLFRFSVFFQCFHNGSVPSQYNVKTDICRRSVQYSDIYNRICMYEENCNSD